MTASRGGELPLSPLGAATWISWRLDPAQRAHYIPLTLAVHGDLDLDRFRAALDTVADRHPELRGRVVATADGPRLRWGDTPPIPFVEQRVGDAPGAVAEAVAAARAAPIDLARGPLTRLVAVHGPGGVTLVVSVHHLVMDGVVIPHLLDELCRAHRGEELGAPPDPEPWLAYVRRAWDLATGPGGEDARAYWHDTLAGLPARPLPTTRGGGSGRPLELAMAPEAERRARAAATRRGVSWFTVALGALAVTLHRHTGADDLVVPVAYHGRRGPGLDGRIGSFANILPVRLRVSDDQTYAELLARAHARLREAVAHGDVALPAILGAAGLAGPAGRTQAHEVVLSQLDFTRTPVDLDALDVTHGARRARLELVEVASPGDYRLTVLLQRDGNGSRAVWQDPGATLDPELLAALAQDHRALLADMADAPGRAVGDGCARLRGASA